MALVASDINFTLETLSGNTILRFTDTSDFSNADGGTLSSATITVTLPDGSSATGSPYDVLTELHNGGATPGDVAIKDFTSIILNGTSTTDQLADGLYTFTYSVDDGVSGPLTRTVKQYLTGESECDVLSVWKKLPDIECICDFEQIKDALFLEGALHQLYNSISCGEESRADDLHTYIDRLAANVNCCN